jgi:hypothetical protein
MEFAFIFAQPKSKFNDHACDPKCLNGLCPLIASRLFVSGQGAFYIG